MSEEKLTLWGLTESEIVGGRIPDIIHNVSRSIFSLARYSGGCNINGKKYIYNTKDDTLTLYKRTRRKKIT